MSHPGPTWGPRRPGLPTALTLEEEARRGLWGHSGARSRSSFLFVGVRLGVGGNLRTWSQKGVLASHWSGLGRRRPGGLGWSWGKGPPGQACRSRPGWRGVCSGSEMERVSVWGEEKLMGEGRARGGAWQGLVMVGIPNFIPESSGKSGKVGGLTPGLCCSEGTPVAVGFSQRRQVPKC